MSRRHLAYRTLQLTHGDTVRWVSGDINGFLETLELETAKMRQVLSCQKIQMPAAV